MSLDTNNPVSNRDDRSVGNIYDRLDAARRKREQILEPPAPANDDRRAVPPSAIPRPFPKLKPPRRDTLVVRAARRWDWAMPWALGLAIFVLIFVFAVR